MDLRSVNTHVDLLAAVMVYGENVDDQEEEAQVEVPERNPQFHHQLLLKAV